MKDIYELLNEANIDVTEIDTKIIEEIEVSELERARGKKKLRDSIKNTPKSGQSQNTRRKKTNKKIAMVASVVFVIGTASIVVAKPAWATNLPIIGDLIQKNLIDINSKYQDYIQAVGQTKSDEGIDITFESAIADNNVLNLSFIVKNNNESIENNITDAMLIPTSLKVNGKKVSTGAGGSYEIIDENTIRVLKNISWDYSELPNKLNVGIEISEMYGKKGDWDVNFALDVSEVRENTYVEKLDKVINVNGVDINLDEVTMTPLTTNIKSSYKYTGGSLEPQLSFMIIDEDGKEIRIEGGGGYNDFKSKRLNQSDIYTNNIDTKTINIIPFYKIDRRLSQNTYEEKLPPTKIDVDNFTPITLKINEDTVINIDKCIVEGEFFICEYSYKYLGTTMTNIPFGNIYVNTDVLDIKDKYLIDEVEEKQRLEKKYRTENTKGQIYIERIGNSKNIEIGCYDGSSTVILKDQAFTVTKK